MKILITGVSGLLGNELAKLLCEDKTNSVYGLSRSAAKLNFPNYTHITVDLNTNGFTDSLPKDINAIIHLAQSEKFRDFPASAEEIFNVNTLSTLKLLDFGRTVGINRFIYASSGGVYGNKDVGFTEESPVMGNGDLGFYLSSKLCAEILADNYSEFFHVVQLRFFFMYGERQNKGMLIPRLLNSVVNKIPITLAGENGIVINPVYIGDAAQAVCKALLIDHSDKINVGGTENISLKQIATTIGSKVKIDPIFEHSKNEAKNLIGDITKMKKMLHVPQTTFEKGIEKLIDHGKK